MTLAMSLFSATDSKYQAREHQNPHFETVTENNDLAALRGNPKTSKIACFQGVEEAWKSVEVMGNQTTYGGLTGMCEKALGNNAF